LTIIEGSKFELFPILPYPCTTFLIQTIHFSSKPSSKQHLFQETPIPLCQGLEVIFRLHSPLHSEKSRLFGFRLWVAAATARQPAWPLEVGSWVGGTPARHGSDWGCRGARGSSLAPACFSPGSVTLHGSRRVGIACFIHLQVGSKP